MPTFFTPITNSTAGNAVAWNNPLTQIDDQLVLMVAGSGFTNQTANRVLAGPTSGGAGAVSFRALVDADIPAALTLSGSTIENSVIGASTPVAGTFSAATVTGAGTVSLTVNGVAGQTRRLVYKTANLERWSIIASLTAEGGSNAGSDLSILRFNDAGAFLATTMTITRSTGKVALEAELQIGGSLNHDGSLLGVYGAAPVAQGALAEPSGTITRTTFDTATVTTAQLAQRVYAMISDLRLKGFFS